MTLGRRFAELFGKQARDELRRLGARTTLGTFNLTSSSLRYLNKWLDRLQAIAGGRRGGHGNYYSDPAAIGLVDNSVRPRILTAAGEAFLSLRPALHHDAARAEYELLKILYSGQFGHPQDVQRLLRSKKDHLLSVLRQLGPTPSRNLFLGRPNLLVIGELLGKFPGAIAKLAVLSREHLVQLSELGERGFANLCAARGFPKGLARLSRRIGGDYTRGEERRLHYLVSMALLEIRQEAPPGKAMVLRVPFPYSNLLTEQDIYVFHSQYTSDITVWFDGRAFQVTASLAPAIVRAAEARPAPGSVSLRPQGDLPAGVGEAAATDPNRNRKRSGKPTKTTVVIDQVLSERAEDFAEQAILRPNHGPSLIRVGHRQGENIGLPDGMVPGADFYVVDRQGTPQDFIEIKSITGQPPVEISLTRAEYWRARRCAAEGIPYRVFLVNVSNRSLWQVDRFVAEIAGIGLENVRQFTVQVG